MDSLSLLQFISRTKMLRILFGIVLFAPLVTASAAAADAAQRIDQSAYASPAHVATDAVGNAVAVWTQFDALPSRSGVWTNRYRAGRGWGEPRLINTNPGQASEPRIAMNARGDTMIVWMQYSDTVAFKVNIWAARYTAAHGWEPAQEIEDDSTNAYFPKVGIDAGGNAIATWSQNDAVQDRTHIYANRYVVGRGWGTGVPLQSDPNALANEPFMAMDAHGNATVAWVQYTAPQNGLWTTRYTANRGWGVAERIADEMANSPAVAVDDRDGAMIAWLEMSTATNLNNVFARRYVDAHWQRAVAVQTDTQNDAAMLKLAMNARGQATALWSEHVIDYRLPNGFSTIFYASDYGREHAWTPPQSIDDGSSYGVPALAIDDRDNVIAAWPRDNSIELTQNLYVYRHAAQRGWDRGQLIGRVQDNAANPDLSASNNGTTALVWQTQDPSGNSALWGDVLPTAPYTDGH